VTIEEPQHPPQRDPTGSRQLRVTTLKYLVSESVYEICCDDVAASIIRDAIVVAAPPPKHPD